MTNDDVVLQSRAKRMITVQLPTRLQSPRFPLQPVRLRRSKVVKHRANPVAHDVAAHLGPVLTIQARGRKGSTVRVPRAFLELEQIKHAIASRELVARELTPTSTQKPKPPKQSRRRSR